LAELPETLDGTYERTLREINEANWEFAHRLFQFVAVASRPLRVKELAELLAFDFQAGSIPKFREDWRLEDPVDAVLSTCSSLLAIVDGGSRFGKVIQFSHFSVREFLTSCRLVEARDITTRRYRISMTPAHTFAAQACLGILLHLDKDATSDSLKRLPLAEYSAEHWVDHAQFEGVSRNVEDGMKQLFDPSKPHLAVCLWIHDPLASTYKRDRRLSLAHIVRLHYAAFWGFHFIVEFLIIEHSQDVHSRLGMFALNLTPLHLASGSGHAEATRILIEHGADVSARNKYGDSPLHMASGRKNAEVARMLIEHGADASARNGMGDTPLHKALYSAKVDVSRMLIERGTDVNAQNDNGLAPLHVASVHGVTEIACMLIEHGADAAAREKHGQTPLHLVLQPRKFIENFTDLSSSEDDTDMSSQSEDGTNMSSQSEGGMDTSSPSKDDMDVSSQSEDSDGTDMSSNSEIMETLFHATMSREGKLVARMLVEHGADVAAQDDDGDTPLHLASGRGEAEVVRMLIEHGADVNARNNSGFTPFRLASDGGHAEVTRALLQHGANSGAHGNMD
jgi:ankyrin repeat protein